MNKKGKLKVNTENILPIIKKWLYSDKDVFLRELVSNASDAIFKVLAITEKSDDENRIDLKYDSTEKTVTISDTGIGMTDDEVTKYIAQVAFSGAKDFLDKYKDKNENIIGHFGLGFFSSFMVAKKVVLETLSYKKGATPVCWESDGSIEYSMKTGTRKSRGTSITLFLEEDATEYADKAKLMAILTQYCRYLPYPIFLDGKQINEKEPLWNRLPKDCKDEDYINFYNELYPADPKPSFWVHLNIDYPFHLKGILYFPKMTKKLDIRDSHFKLFYQRVFVSDNCKEILPDYLSMARGAIDSTDIPLNVSRSYLQTDNTVRKIGKYISKKIVNKIDNMFKNSREQYNASWEDIEPHIKIGLLNDEKFRDNVVDFLIWKTLDGEWLSIKEYLKKNPSNNIYYTMKENSSMQCLNLYKEKKIDVLVTHPLFDNHVIQRLEETNSEIKFKRIDSALDKDILDEEREKSLLDKDGRSQASLMAEFFKKTLAIDGLDVEAKSLASDNICSLFVYDEQNRRFHDMMKMHIENSPMSQINSKKFVVNTNNKLVQKAYDLKGSDLAVNLVRQIYDYALLSQGEIDPAEMDSMLQRNQDMMVELVGRLK